MIDYDALLERLEVSGLGEIGTSITFETMPETISKGICIRSRISGNVIDYEIPGLQRGEFRLISRATRFEEGETLLRNAINALEIIHKPEQVGKMRVRYCRAETTPMAFPVSDGNLREFAVNMNICYDYQPDVDVSLNEQINTIKELVAEKTGRNINTLDDVIEGLQLLQMTGE